MTSYTTFQDVIDHGLDYLGSNPSDQAKRDCVRAALSAYRDIANAFNWTYLYTQSRIVTRPSYVSVAAGSSVAYDATGGTYPRQMTISGDTWPSWAALGVIRIGQAAYKVDQRVSATVITLDEVLSPPDDLASGTEFTLYQDTFLLPDDYVSQDQSLYELNFGGMQFAHPREWLFQSRYVLSSGTPQHYTITGDSKFPGRLVTRLFPWPDLQSSIDFIYKRRPRALMISLVNAGTVSVDADDTALTGVGTTFTPGMVGSVIRLSGNSRPPTSLIMGSNPSTFETTIASYVSATELVLSSPAPVDFVSSGYTVSDPIDIEQGAMLNAYLRCVEMHIGMSRTLKDKPSAAAQYREALSAAKAADSRSFAGRSVGGTGRYRMRLAYMPTGPDEP